MLFASATLDEVARLLTAASPGPGGLRVASLPTAVDPLVFVRAGADGPGWAGFFGMPGHDEVGGLGAAVRIGAEPGEGRFDELQAGIGKATGGAPAPARLLFGFSFSAAGARLSHWAGFGAASAVLPAAAVAGEPGARRLVVAAHPDGPDPAELLARLEDPGPAGDVEAADHGLHSVPAPSEWRRSVAAALESIRSGTITKVVLARSVEVQAGTPPPAFDVVARLRAGYPRCYVYGWREGAVSFVGASPELLVARSGSDVRSNPLAGSAGRGEGEDEDAFLTAGLMTSGKDRSEHELVVDDIARRLGTVTRSLHVPARPSIAKMASVQHLSTLISGELAEPRSVVELAGLLHPTPAVGGTPRAEALALIERLESIDRGWYAGGIGALDPAGNGVVAVALRCGLMTDGMARLYAGAGIVAGSNPSAELAETRLKLRPLLDLLSAT